MAAHILVFGGVKSMGVRISGLKLLCPDFFFQL